MARDVWREGCAKDATSVVPWGRWDMDAAAQLVDPGVVQPRFGVFLSEDGSSFDAAAFDISASEAALMDPQQRLLLECGTEALLQARWAERCAAAGPGTGDDCGVFVGISSMDYQKLISRYVTGVTAYSATGVTLSVAAGRLSYTIGLRGPSMSIDTACSSSLVGAHMAVLSMQAGGCSAAVAAGIKLILTPSLSAMFSRAGMLAADGRCKTLDGAADGYVRCEALAALLLAPWDDSGVAARSGAPLAVLTGSAVNQDGRSSSLTAPNGPQQQAVMRQALMVAGRAPEEVGILQMHGTGREAHRWRVVA